MTQKITAQVSEIKPILASLNDADGLLSEWQSVFELGRIGKVGRRAKSKPGYRYELMYVVALMRIMMAAYSIKFYFSRKLEASDAYSQNAFYRDMSDPHANWRRQLNSLNRQIASVHDQSAAYDDRLATMRTTALVIDDTISRHCGKDMEGSSQVHDHTDNTRPRGYKLLALGWYNGSNMRVADFCAVRESVKPTPYTREDDMGCPAMVRKRELDQSKISLSVAMLKRAHAEGLIPDYVLVDSWFTVPDLINAVKEIWQGETHFLGMLRMDLKRKLSVNGKATNLDELRKSLKKKGLMHKCRCFGSTYMAAECEIPGIGRVKLFFSRMGRRGTWKVLLTTNLDLSYIEAMRTYAIRWGIEVLFRECKELLGLDKCQCRQFNSQIAHWTMVFSAHALLTTERHARDCRSLGELFRNTKESFDQQALAERLIAMFEQILVKIADQFGGADNVSLAELMESQAYKEFKDLLQLSSVQSVILRNAS